MANLRDFNHKKLYDFKVSKVDAYEIKKREDLKDGGKLSILSDSMFKTMFYNENRIKYSCKFISYFVDISYEKLLDNLVLVKGDFNKSFENEKDRRGDYVACIDGTFINIEINNNSCSDILERNIEYLYRQYSYKNKKKSNKYSQTIQINFNNFSFLGNDKILDRYGLMNDEGILLTDKILILNIYIPNLIKKWYNLGVEKLELYEKYALLLICDDEELFNKIKGDDLIFMEYVDEAVVVSKDDDLLESYDKEWALKDEAYRDGFMEGREDGEKEGREEGRKESERLIAIELLKNDISYEIISKSTGLSIENIKELEKNI